MQIASTANANLRANGVLTVQMAPDQILAALSLEFPDELLAPQIEEAVVDIEARIRAAHPDIVTVFVKPHTAKTFRETVRRRRRGMTNQWFWTDESNCCQLNPPQDSMTE